MMMPEGYGRADSKLANGVGSLLASLGKGLIQILKNLLATEKKVSPRLLSAPHCAWFGLKD